MKYKETSSNTKGRAKVTVKGSKTLIKFDDKEDVIKIATPDWLKFQGTDTFYVKLNSDGDEISVISPQNGRFYSSGSKVKFVAREGEVATPQMKEARTGKAKDGRQYTIDAHKEFAISILIESPDSHANMSVLVSLWYLFDDDDGSILVEGRGKSFNLLKSFLDVTGVSEIDVKYSDNVLPSLAKKIAKLDRKFSFVVTGGYVTEFEDASDLDDELEDEDDEDETPFGKPKQASKPLPEQPSYDEDADEEDEAF